MTILMHMHFDGESECIGMGATERTGLTSDFVLGTLPLSSEEWALCKLVT